MLLANECTPMEELCYRLNYIMCYSTYPQKVRLTTSPSEASLKSICINICTYCSNQIEVTPAWSINKRYIIKLVSRNGKPI